MKLRVKTREICLQFAQNIFCDSVLIGNVCWQRSVQKGSCEGLKQCEQCSNSSPVALIGLSNVCYQIHKAERHHHEVGWQSRARRAQFIGFNFTMISSGARVRFLNPLLLSAFHATQLTGTFVSCLDFFVNGLINETGNQPSDTKSWIFSRAKSSARPKRFLNWSNQLLQQCNWLPSASVHSQHCKVLLPLVSFTSTLINRLRRFQLLTTIIFV